ncbi:hypothetical protein PAAG_08219 [Paracoccidioides lutzii Pb01]|uniref:DUF4211 domain-containing protein n=1 Tax=Paracoccidioides lutzii (strain ATCC MYA-826 / Pb01) TaxID=502779 RepID=C1HBS8_PARBA|nr:hypothetical protein PAAG_08219 [Paracoccidioides lutzii Pb01]EEH38492.1 hypothetical protein PAAG_08219 [Paracoccidioides lutzii Pb01]
MPPSARPTRYKGAERQTRLAFTPVSSSSPGFSLGIDRAATMLYKSTFNSPGNNGSLKKTKAPISKSLQSNEQGDASSDEESIRAPSSSRRPLERLIIADKDEEDGEESEDIICSSPVKRRRRYVRPEVRKEDSTLSFRGGPLKPLVIKDECDDDGEESDEIFCSSPAKRRRWNVEPDVAKQETPRNRAEQDKLDLEEDLEDLRDSVTTRTRTRRGVADKAKLKRQSQLEVLRRRRAGEKTEVVSVNSSGDESEAAQSEPNGNKSPSEEEEEGSWFNQNEDSDIEPPVPEDLDKYDEDFVDQDDEGALGAPDELNNIPFEFTRHRYKRLRDHFKDVVEWMVHNKLNPAFPRDDVVYRVAFSKVKDEVTGLAGSQLISSAWNRDFRKSLEARPGIYVSGYPLSLGHSCDACNKTNHPASFDIRFDGKPYLLETLDPISDDESDGSDSVEGDTDADEGSERPGSGNIDREGNEIPDASIHFYLGRHCKTKAVMAHTLIHWRYHLNEWIIDYLRRKGVFADHEVLGREHWSHKRRTKYSNQVVDAMEEDGEINRLWRDFNTNLKTAREAKESRW